MAPRANLQQAIELLKIHQLRRENTVIYKQLQTLQNEVSDVHNTNSETRSRLDQTQKDYQSVYARAKVHDNHLESIGSSVKCMKQCIDGLQSTIEDLRARLTSQSDICANQYIEVSTRIDEAQKKCKEKGERYEHAQEEMDNRLNGSSQQSAQRKVWEDSICERLSTMENQIAAVQMQRCSVEGVNQACEGIEEVIRFSGKESDENALEIVRPSHPDDMLTTEEPDLESMPAHNPCDKTCHAIVPDDLDLDENATRVSYAEHDVNSSGCNKSHAMVLHHAIDKDGQMKTSPYLTQDVQETIAAYLVRGLRLIDCLSDSEAVVVLRQFVDGLAVKRQQSVFATWFNSTSWSKEKLRDIACLHGVNMTRPQENGVSKPESSTYAFDGNLEPQEESRTLIAVTETDNTGTGSEEQIEKEQASSPKVQTRPRRSQRLAAKSQTQLQTHSITAVETESQAEALDARVAGAARSYVAGNGLTSCVPRKRKRIEREAPVKTKPPAVDVIRNINHQKNRETTRNAASLCLRQNASQGQFRSSTESVKMLKPPRTPTRQLFRSKAPKTSQTPKARPSSPLFGKTTKTKHKTLKILETNLERANLKPSPYRPQPRLVPQTGHDIQTSRHTEMTSDLEVFLPYPKNSAKQASHAKELPKIGPPSKRRRLPLPPPPVIPILSTSTEEDRRFDQW